MTLVEGPAVASVRHVRVPGLLLAGVFIAAGFAITFTQDLHGDLLFNQGVFAIFGIAAGMILLGTAFARTGAPARTPLIVLGVASFGAGLATLFATSVPILSIIITVWAAAVTVVLVWVWARERLRELLVLAILSGVLAIVLAAGARELPAVMGFFGGYAVITAVYLAIASVDTAKRSTTVPDEAPAKSGS